MRQKHLTKLAALLVIVPVMSMAEIKPGSVVIYSDGDAEKLLAANKEWSLWEDQRKRQYKRAYLPYFPVLEYRRFGEEPSGYDQFVPDLSEVELKPFSDRESVQFDLTRRDLQKGTKKRLWRCSYAGIGSYVLRKQQLKTHEYSCRRLVVDKRFIEKVREQLLLSYSPELNLVVKQVKTNRYGKEQLVQVERILTPERATRKRIARTVYKITSR
ncbi:hypothetical protein [Amphritea pacifica]|uniref:ABL domain-containing protein n=1 Tax=Amphritea pacifica TaxID=2811233 RepID=A0ABS2W4E1_9GAMM|nr:hypothetical protein [Amphritea pacifica]MBN0986579.1 hypothetical protein [Amphritea pacifica]MBN1008461.1 hypothetical protein [Amphritea pacifica]